MTSFLSLWLPHLPTDRLARRMAGGRDPRGLVTVARVGGALRVAAADPAARTGGIGPGLALADARAIRPDLAVAEADPRGEARTLAAVADWCGRFTPLVALDGADGLVLDVGGADHLFGGPAALLDAVETGLGARGFAARGGVAATPEAAWALARFGGAVRIAPASGGDALRDLVAELPLGALRLGPAAVGALAQVGLLTVGHVLARPRAPLAARFGDELFARLDAVLGGLRVPISPRAEPPDFSAERRFADPVATREGVERALAELGVHLCAALQRHGRGARRVEARLVRVDGAVLRIAVGTGQPLDRPAALARLFRDRIEGAGEDGLDTGYGFDALRLWAPRTDPMPAEQPALAGEGWAGRATAEGSAAALADLLDRLGARLGLRHVSRLAGEASHVPERAARAVPAAEAPARDRGAPHPAAPERPLRLFDPPEPITGTLSTVPDGPPRRFQWRRAVHDVVAVEGPERIAAEWWRAGGPTLTRDYFRAEDRGGRRYWLFREGLAGELVAAEPEDGDAVLRPRWFLHGLFG